MIKTVLVDIDVLSIVSSGDAHSAIAGRDGRPPVEWGHPVGAGRRSGNADAFDPGSRCRRASPLGRGLDPPTRQHRHTGLLAAATLFVLGMLACIASLGAWLHQDFAEREVLLWSLIMVIAGAILAAYDRIVVGGVQASSAVGLDGSRSPASSSGGPVVGNAIPAVRLSRREQEVLQLVSEGYSNSMIAGRLHLSENTIKTYVENLLSRLNAPNRAEAVAAASRQNLI